MTATSGFDLDVRATFASGVFGALVIDDDTAPFFDSLSVLADGRWTGIDRASILRCAKPCRVRYRVGLANAAARLADVDTAIALGGAVFAPPSAWLARPATAPAGARFRFHVTTPPGVRFLTGVRPAPGADDTYEAATDTMDESSYAGFGALDVERVAPPDIIVAGAPQNTIPNAVAARWVRSEFSAIDDYFGRAPDDRVVVFLAPGQGEMTRGKTLGGGGASVFVRIGSKVGASTVEAEDWVVAHELVHVAFPEINPPHPWFSEGLASYVEPVARARENIITREKFWLDLVQGLPQGLPGPGARGLDADEEWGRVYWGGSLYFLLADVAIRTATHGARSLCDAVRGMAASANVEFGRAFDDVLDQGDRATGTAVLHDLYRRLGQAPGTEDLAALYGRLGVKSASAGVEFDDSAPLADVRRAITENPEGTLPRNLTPEGR